MASTTHHQKYYLAGIIILFLCTMFFSACEKKEIDKDFEIQNDTLDAAFHTDLGNSRQIYVSGEENTVEIIVAQNVDYQLHPVSDWIHPLETKSVSTERHYFRVDSNSSDNIRKGQVVIESSDKHIGDTLTVFQYVLPSSFSIPLADIEDNEYVNWSQNRSGVGKALGYNFEVTGVFKVWAILRELAVNGTTHRTPEDIRAEFLRHKPVVLNDSPARISSIEVFRNGTLKTKEIHFEDFCDFLFTPNYDAYILGFGDNDDLFGGVHGLCTVGAVYVALNPVMDISGIRIGIFDHGWDYDIGGSEPEDYLSSYQAQYKYYQDHPEMLFYSTCSSDVSDGQIPDTRHLPNAAIHMAAFGNRVPIRNGDCYYCGPNLEVRRWTVPEGFIQKYVRKWDDPDVPFSIEFRPWSLGEAEGVVGGDNEGKSGYKSESYSCYPTKDRIKDDDIWCETSLWDYDDYSEATSPACPMAMAKYFLSSLMNYALNPSISISENRKIIRKNCIDHYCYEDGELYMVGKRINPGASIEQYFSNIPETINLEGDTLIPISTTVFKGSIIVGPGVVDEHGTPIKEDNYTQAWGKKLFVSPSYLRNCGYKSGDQIKFVEYLCLDSKGSGTGNPKDAYKSIVSNRVRVFIK